MPVSSPGGVPAAPLIVHDPYLSVWSATDRLTDDWPVHWSGKARSMAGLARIDGRPFRFLGRLSHHSPLEAAANTIIGNTVLYGATDGYLFAAGRAGERFAVRNSGAKVVVEGCGSNGCEYMTGGVAVILGKVGANFGAGMTGGMAYLYDIDGGAQSLMNFESLVVVPVNEGHYMKELETLLEMHLAETGSQRAATILQHWDEEKDKFLQVVPKEMLNKLKIPVDLGRAIPAE